MAGDGSPADDAEPATRTAPPSYGSTPAMHSKRVVLPEPFGPISPSTSPARTSNDTSSNATTRPYRLERCLTSTRLRAGVDILGSNKKSLNLAILAPLLPETVTTY